MIYSGTKWAERLNFLAKIEDGWYDGDGEAINANVLEEANMLLNSLDSPTFHVPALFPLLNDSDEEEFVDEGGISMEWVQRDIAAEDRYHITLQISNRFAYEIYVFNLVNHEMHFMETDSFDEASMFLKEHLVRVGFVSGKGDMK